MTSPVLHDDEMYKLLRIGEVEKFNQMKAAGGSCNLKSADLRGLDLRSIDAKGLDMSNSYLRQADLRGIDFSETNLEGASINGSKISGTLFPKALTAEEINLSLVHGTRMRYKDG